MPAIFLCLSWLGLLTDYPEAKTYLWFSFHAALTAACAVIHLRTRREKFSVEFLFSLVILIAGISAVLKIQWLQLSYFPLAIALAYLYPLRTTMQATSLFPVVGLKKSLASLVTLLINNTAFSSEFLVEETAFSVSLMLTALIAGIMADIKERKNRGLETGLKKIVDDAKGLTLDTDMETLRTDELSSHFFASASQADKEIMDLLSVTKKAVLADSVNLFVVRSDGLELRHTTEEKDIVVPQKGGIIAQCVREKKSLSSGDLQGKKLEAGYMKKNNLLISSVVAVPIREGATITGVLTADSSRYHAFSGLGDAGKTVEMLADQLAKILERRRISLEMKREMAGRKILTEGSSCLVTSLDIDELSEQICRVAEKIATSQTFFFLRHGRRFELRYCTGEAPEGKKLFDFGGTVVNFAIENKDKHYVSDLSQYPIRVMPFHTENIRSAMAIPMIYENKILGLLVMLSEEKDFLDAYQTNLLLIIRNQASISIANARLHAEIEEMATTDGLTGLLNHRRFQEKLSDEIKRLKRSGEPIALLLTDIDYFKKVNDTYGHPVGDFVLKGVSGIIRDTIRDIDIPARYGGEEFAVILPGTDGVGAANTAERLRKAVEEKSFSADGKTLKVTISIGISTAPGDATGQEELIDKADKALYHAKHNGRNQSVAWNTIR